MAGEKPWQEDTGLFEPPTPSTLDLPTAIPRRAVLVVLVGQSAGQTYILDSSVVIGRDAAADVIIDFSDVSRRHAAIERTPEGGFVLRDLGSRNGTLLNGVPIQEAPLKFGDRISIGSQATLLFALFEPLSDEIHQLQRIESLGRLASGVAHDFNNLLTVIMGSLSYILDRPSSTAVGEPDIRACLTDAITAAKRSSELTAQILSFARGTKAEMGVIDLSRLLEEVLRIVQRTFGPTVRVETKIEPNLVMVGDRSQLTQILMNLCLNARDAMPGGGMLVVTARLDPAVPEAAASIVLCVRDSGQGMEPAIRDRVFEPFFTTKPQGRGTGLGLSIVHGIVKNHGGQIEVESEPGRGSAFVLRFPPAAGDTTRSPSPVPAPRRSTPPRRGTVLVVDDEDLQLRTSRRILETLGHRVLIAKTLVEAVALYQTNRYDIEVVLLDLVMPDGGGEAVYQALKQIDPDVRVLACSGYSAPDRTRRMLDAGARGFLEKPYDRQMLEAALSRAVASA